MFEISVKKVDFEKSNTIIKKNINLDNNLDCFILISSSNEKLAENILNNSLEYIIDKVTKKNTYKEFSIALESVNWYLKTWRLDEEENDSLDMIIWVLNENQYIFSNIWNTSAYLINKNSEVIELTEKNENKPNFSYISSWTLMNWDIVINATIDLLNYLSKSDLIDWLVLSEDIKIFNKNIKNILHSEIIDKNCLVSSLKYINKKQEKKNENLEIAKEILMKAIDNKIFKIIIWHILRLKDKINKKSKKIKNILFIFWIIISVFFLYTTLSKIVSVTTQTETREIAKNNIIEIRNLIRQASENVSNPEIFERHIKEAEKMLKELENKELFLSDISKINEDINILKKQFNKIEIFEEKDSSLVYEIETPWAVKVVKYNLIPYLLNQKSVVWPILSTTKPTVYTFNSLSDDEFFVDWVFIDWNMIILTNKSKIVRFTRNWHFSFVNVIWQQTWWEIKSIETYNSSLYTLTKANQINMHSVSWNDFRAWTERLKSEDVTQIWEVRDIAIDWWFYMLKEDLTLVKFFSNPYRVEGIILNNLPRNYTKEEWTRVEIKARNDLNYVYFLLNNKIWVFKPNTTNFRNTQSLTYIWQIEWSKEKIKDFYINYDWEIIVLNEKWIYKLNFEVSNDKLIVK
jgi:hypothetical protein